MMTNEETIEVLDDMKVKIDIPKSAITQCKRNEALDKAIKALEQQTCDDCISRKAAKNALEDRFMELQKIHSKDRYETNFCLNTILELPSVTPSSNGLNKIISSVQ